MKKKIEIKVSKPTHDKAQALTQEDVWGSFAGNKRVSWGMIVADSKYGGKNEKDALSTLPCPFFNDRIPYKSVTVVCDVKWEDEVGYWLEYVHGGNCISKVKYIHDSETNKKYVAVRSDYQCW